MPDRLEMMLELQRTLQHRLFATKIGLDFDRLDNEQRVAFIKDNIHFIVEELHEMSRELPFVKHWKTYEVTEDMWNEALAKARKEYTDAMHFFLNVGLLLGLDAGGIYTEYVLKNTVNHIRQDNNY